MIAETLKFRTGDHVQFKNSPYHLESMSVVRTNCSYLGIPVVQCKWYNTIKKRWEYETFEEEFLEHNVVPKIN